MLQPGRQAVRIRDPAAARHHYHAHVASLSEVQRRFLVAEEEATLRLASTWQQARASVEARLAAAVADGRSLSDIAYYRALERDVAAITTQAAQASAAWANQTVATAYVEGGLTQFADMDFTLVNDRAVREASRYTAGLITQVGVEMQNAVHAQVLQGIAGAWQPEQLEEAILRTGLQRGPWRSPEQRAAVIARTETMRAYNAGAVAGIREAGADRVEWIATEDERTCPICSPRDGQTYPVGEVDVPAHPRCRCIVTAWYPDVGAPQVTPPAGGPTDTARPGEAHMFTEEQLRAMTPQGQWSAEYRDQMLATLRSTDEGTVLADTLDRFQDGGSIARLRKKIEARLRGEVIDATSTKRADAILGALRSAPTDWAPDVVYRGMSIRGKLEKVLASYQPGQRLNLNLTSFSSDRAIAKKFQYMTSSSGSTNVMVELVGPGKRMLPIQNLARDRRLFKEREWVGGGEFEVLEVKKASGGVLVRMRQVGTP